MPYLSIVNIKNRKINFDRNRDHAPLNNLLIFKDHNDKHCNTIFGQINRHLIYEAPPSPKNVFYEDIY